MGIALVQLSQQHLQEALMVPVYIYIHSSLIEPVEITALQKIIIIDPCEIHSLRLNILIYIQFERNQRTDTCIQRTQALVQNMFI